MKLQNVLPNDIERRSMEIIGEELGQIRIDEDKIEEILEQYETKKGKEAPKNIEDKRKNEDKVNKEYKEPHFEDNRRSEHKVNIDLKDEPENIDDNRNSEDQVNNEHKEPQEIIEANRRSEEEDKFSDEQKDENDDNELYKEYFQYLQFQFCLLLYLLLKHFLGMLQQQRNQHPHLH